MIKKSIFGLHENLAAAFAYAGVFITGIITLIMERENKFVRFHALQSTVFFGFIAIIQLITNIIRIPFISGLIASAVGLVGFAVYIFLIYCAVSGKKFKLPILGDIVWDQINK